jgi:EAL domain-containing protein (putative c-di-GMP-specific phosphodiesterase class I)
LGRRILVVEDDSIVLRSVARILVRSGYDVLPASDVESALHIVDSTPIDAAIVDYSLSRETGLTVLSHLLEVQPRCVRVLLTGRSDADIFVESVNRGEVAKVIKKPFVAERLLKELEDAFDNAERRKRAANALYVAEHESERHAVEQAIRGHLGLALQPIFLIGAGVPQIFAFEALLRPKHALLNTPLALLAAAERHEMIPDLGSAVFSRASVILRRLPRPATLFLNLHPEQLGRPERLASDLRMLSGDTDRVVIEITEQSSLTRLDRWEESIRQITDSGCRLAVDDLGSGYSSLSILADLQPAFIKLDMSLVRNIHHEPRKQRLVSLMRTFADATDAAVIAEGVESAEETQALLECGIELVQGFHFARPSESFVPAAEAASELAAGP